MGNGLCILVITRTILGCTNRRNLIRSINVCPLETPSIKMGSKFSTLGGMNLDER